MLGLAAVGLVIKNSRLRWFGYVECKEDVDWVTRPVTMKIDGTSRWPTAMGRPSLHILLETVHQVFLELREKFVGTV